RRANQHLHQLPRYKNQLARIFRPKLASIKVGIHVLNNEPTPGKQVFHLELESISQREWMHDALNATAFISDAVDELIIRDLCEPIVSDDPRMTFDGSTIREEKLRIDYELYSHLLVHQHFQRWIE